MSVHSFAQSQSEAKPVKHLVTRSLQSAARALGNPPWRIAIRHPPIMTALFAGSQSGWTTAAAARCGSRVSSGAPGRARCCI